MTNTTKRVLSALVLLLLVALCVFLGETASTIMIILLGSLVIEELAHNFFSYQRSSFFYIAAQLLYLFPVIYLNFILVDQGFFYFFSYAGIFLNILLLLYLWSSLSLKEELKKFSGHFILLAIYVLVPIMSFTYLVHRSSWVLLILGLILINSMTDIGAWLWGKTLGRHKLWPAVSPNKTVEGFIGGVLTSTAVTSLFWEYRMSGINIVLISAFFIMAACAQLGDLVQSKFKREFGIKDSSQLIPGHGGVFDRIDSFLFVTPLYTFVLMTFVAH